MKRVLVTGAAGFLGAHVVHALLEADLVPIAAARSGSDRWRLAEVEGLEWAALDVADHQSVVACLSAAAPDYVVHCAAYGVDYRQQDTAAAVSVNVTGTALLLEAAAQAGVQRFVHVGTCYEYGDKSHAVTEDEPLEPTALYGATKAAGTLLALERARTLGVPLSIVRPFGMYGPMEGSHKLVPLIQRACEAGQPLPLTAGEQVRDYIFVKDVARAIVRLLQAETFPEGEVFNLGSGCGLTLREFITGAARAFGGEALMKFGDLPYRANEMWCLVADMRKWESFAGGPAGTTSLSDGFRTMIHA